MFGTNTRGGKAFAAEKKIRKLKKKIGENESFRKKRKKRIKPNNLIKQNKQHEQR